MAELKPNSSAVLVEIDKNTMQIRRRIRVADQLGCVAASERTFIAGNWDSRRLYEFDLAVAQPVRIVRNPTRTRYQDKKLVDLYLVPEDGPSRVFHFRMGETLAAL